MRRPVWKLSLSRVAVSALLLVVAWSAGCASSQTRSDADQRVEGTPPSEDEEAAQGSLPDGPPVYVGDTQLSSDSGQEKRPDESASANDGEAGDVSSDGPTVAREQLKSLLEKGPAYILRAVQVEPMHRDGEFRGFEIQSMSKTASEAVNPELKVGDVVTHLDGKRLKKPDDYLSVWKRLPELSEIKVEYRRDGEPNEVTWTVVR